MNIAMRTRIKRLREEKGISQSQMAEKLHMDERNYKRIESGEKKTMDTDMLTRIAEVLETDVADLFAAEINIENHGDVTNEGGVAVSYANEVHITNNTATDLIGELKAIIEANRETIAENSRIIAMLLEQQAKK